MALKAGYVGVKRWLYEKLQATTKKNVQDIADIWATDAVMSAKNVLDNTASTTGVFTVNADKTVTVAATSVGANQWLLVNHFTLAKGSYKLYKCGLNDPLAHDTNARIIIYTGSDYGTTLVKADANAVANFTLENDTEIWVRLQIVSGATVNGVLKPMITLASDNSDIYAPYAMTNHELTTSKLSIGVELSSADDLNNVKETGLYCVTATPANTPESKNYYTLLVNRRTSGDVKQVIFKDSTMYLRSYGGSTPSWTSWYKYTGTAVTQAKAPTDEPELATEDPETVTKTTRKTTKKEDN